MQSSISTVSPLGQRMMEDMRWRKLAPKTQSAYIRALRKFVKFLSHSPDTATIVGSNFLLEVTLGRPQAMAKMQSVRVPQKLPVVLS